MEIKRRLLAGRVFRISIYAFLLSFPFFMGCATIAQKDNVLAVVDGTPITESDLAYALNISHRREDLSSAKTLDVSSYMEKLIDDRLIYDEALRMGLDQLPEVRGKMEAYIKRESVMRLHKEEIIQKISLTEDDIINEYKKNYLHFGVIELNSEDEAKAVQEKLVKGDDFSELARAHSKHFSKEKGGEVIYPRSGLVPSLRDALSKLKTDETSDILNNDGKYYLLKLLDNKETDEAFKNVKESIAGALKGQRQGELEESYLKTLREKAAITINEELLGEIDFAGGKEEIDKWINDTSPLAEGNTAVITVGEFVNGVFLMKQGLPKTLEEKKGILDSRIDVKLLDQEALSRHYETKDLKDEAEGYENYLLKKAFINNVIFPQIVLTDDKLQDYYKKNQKRYTIPAVFKLQQIQVKTIEDAEDAMSNLKNGADFLWLAKRKLPPSMNEDTIDMGWVSKNHLPEPLMESIDSMKPGDFSPVFKNNGVYVIVQVLDKIGEKVKDFESVRKEVEKALIDEQYSDLLEKNIMQLRQDAQIIIHDNAVRKLEKKLEK
ncbi:MAG: peptidyl-prolyl cis-trans isomerase [Nitrospirota bacterium]|nr:peptidyl-prolyl cis-trans isomerase [Nitrospirota bacterium]